MGEEGDDAKAVISLFPRARQLRPRPGHRYPGDHPRSVSRRRHRPPGGRYTDDPRSHRHPAGFFGVGFSVVFALWIGSAP